MIWVGSVTVLVLLQPNFSTGAMIFLISLIMLFVGRARMLHLGFTVGALVPLLGVYMLSAEYRMRRIMSYIDGSGGGKTNYQLWQGMIGFGNGGVFGLGPGNSRQRDLFLPESYGDFVFSIVGEEYGLIGTLFIVGLFLLIMLRGIRIATARAGRPRPLPGDRDHRGDRVLRPRERGGDAWDSADDGAPDAVRQLRRVVDDLLGRGGGRAA